MSLLCRWYGSGTIPTFKLVIGVSIGPMIAPFAFLGGSYYNRLRTMYTTLTSSEIMTERELTASRLG